jgi:hypothetical protein
MLRPDIGGKRLFKLMDHGTEHKLLAVYKPIHHRMQFTSHVLGITRRVGK